MVNTYDIVEISIKDTLATNFLYHSLPGRLLLRVLTRPVVSALFGAIAKSGFSGRLIPGFVRKNNIDMNEYVKTDYKSFNDFFIREAKKESRPFPEDANDVAAPCDGKLTAYRIGGDNVFHIKDSAYDIYSILDDKTLADEFIGGVFLIFRLTPDDYHRYFYIDDGETLSHKKIKGVLHTVKPISGVRYNVYRQNSREYTVMQTKNYGKVIQMEVGALFVGRITNHRTSGVFVRGEEKGMFEFGGSTVVMIFQKGKVTIDETIYANTRQNRETVVRLGCKVGRKG